MQNVKNMLHNIGLSSRKNENEAFWIFFALHFDPALVEFVSKLMAHPVRVTILVRLSRGKLTVDTVVVKLFIKLEI